MFKNLVFYFCLLCVFFLSGGCKSNNNDRPRFVAIPPGQSGIHFSNTITVSDSFGILDFDYMYNGGGVAVGDFDNDGLPDIFFTGNMVSSALYLNKGNFQFTDVTAQAGLTTTSWTEGVTVVDINNDGWLDIYVSVSNQDRSNPDPNLLFINGGLNAEGVPIFTERASAFGIDDRGFNTQAVFFDYNNDGHLDLYILSNALESFQRNLSRPREVTGKGKSTDKLYRNNGNGTFTDVSKSAGILIEGYGLGVAISDINKDGWPDIYVANDFLTNDLLYINNADGTFSNQIASRIDHQSFNAMGVDVADYNNDGWTDVMVVDMFPPDNYRQKTMFSPTENYDLYMNNLSRGYEPQYVRNTLQLNDGNGAFSEIGQLAGVHQTDWSWSPLLADFDNDGYRDLFISNGYGKDVTDMDYIAFYQNLGPFISPEERRNKLLSGLALLQEVKLPNYIFKNNHDLTFSDVSKQWGFTQASISNGAAYADLDNDGDLDLIINNLNEKAFILKNTTRENGTDSDTNFITIGLAGDSLNPMGIGTKITIHYTTHGSNKIQYHEHFPSKGYKSFMHSKIHFGLGSVTLIDSIHLQWADGSVGKQTNIPTNQHITFTHDRSINDATPKPPAKNPVVIDVTAEAKLSYIHQSRVFKDFNRQRLLPHKHSENGPGVAVGDVNGDGLDDFYVGGSVDHSGIIFQQQKDGTFKPFPLADKAPYDDMGALFFDCDNDGDLDLYVVSGGSRYLENAPEYQDRLYINDGTGVFILTKDRLPDMTFSGSVVTAADYDGDGDLDLFVGGRVRPGNYPLPPRSALLKNEGGKFIDATEESIPDLKSAGMITSAIWTDFDNDGLMDLIVVGEWMSVRFFKGSRNQNGSTTFSDKSDHFLTQPSKGWWNSILTVDSDKNGSPMYILGNLGLNTRWKAPLSLHANDFDRNGSVDPIMFQYLQDEKYAVPGRDALVGQIPAWRKQFLKYSDYGNTTYRNFFSDDNKKDIYTLEANNFQSCIMQRGNNGIYTLTPLPILAQTSPIFGTLSDDFTRNGQQSLLLIGNFYGNETVTGRYDALKGILLESNDEGYKSIPSHESGFNVHGEGRALVKLLGADHQYKYLAAQFNDSLKLYSIKAPAATEKIIRLKHLDYKAIIELQNGTTIVREFNYGSGYLSQSSRSIFVGDHVKKITLIDYQKTSRVVFPYA